MPQTAPQSLRARQDRELGSQGAKNQVQSTVHKVPLESGYIQLLTGETRMAGKGTWKDEAQHARDMGLSEERQGDARHAAVGITTTMKIVNQMQGPTE
ncbi:hypothetical protein FVEG_14737 [Fusarium verticillioides 7600]|uniref:Uncharacterized protein n=1 Tax=Gibberella moniliformis (strain M3125 / FGSC 7600) TaxID=334819 RepID=W7LNC8_GIBM7|nr:hypothetical protein FVEG_14737 [Fusarium verticillioides 7600]EWG36990.1 hypothetical protein FVEG_14737 [Fusarium verticillioides 7600]